MSHEMYNTQWKEAMEDLSALIVKETPAAPAEVKVRLPPAAHTGSKRPLHSPLCVVKAQVISWDDAFAHFCQLFIGYTKVYNKLEDCYDQVLECC